MPSLHALVADSPFADRVITAAYMASCAFGMQAEYLHISTPERPSTGRLGERIERLTGVPGNLRIVHAPTVAAAIKQHLFKPAPDLLVLGAVAREPALRDLFGSTARRIAQRAPCSVLMVSTSGRNPEHWSRFLVAARYDAQGAAVAESAAALARQSQESEPPSICFAREAGPYAGRRDVSRPFSWTPGDLAALTPAQYELAAFADAYRSPELRTEAVLLDGRPGQEIARYAEDGQYDVLAVSVRRKPLGLLTRAFSHPVQLILSQLPCSLLLHRADRPLSAGETA